MKTQQKLKSRISTKTQSLHVVKDFLRMSLSTISYYQNVYDRENFVVDEYQFSPSSSSSIKYFNFDTKNRRNGTNNEYDYFLNILEKGIFKSIELEYLKKLIIGICEDQTKSFETLTETYEFNFKYGESKVVVNMDGRKNDVLIEKDFANLMKRIVSICSVANSGNVRGEKRKRFLTFKLVYNENCPNDYRPEGFRGLNKKEDQNFLLLKEEGDMRNATEKNLGEINTNFHSLNLNFFDQLEITNMKKDFGGGSGDGVKDISLKSILEDDYDDDEVVDRKFRKIAKYHSDDESNNSDNDESSEEEDDDEDEKDEYRNRAFDRKDEIVELGYFKKKETVEEEGDDSGEKSPSVLNKRKRTSKNENEIKEDEAILRMDNLERPTKKRKLNSDEDNTVPKSFQKEEENKEEPVAMIDEENVVMIDEEKGTEVEEDEGKKQEAVEMKDEIEGEGEEGDKEEEEEEEEDPFVSKGTIRYNDLVHATYICQTKEALHVHQKLEL